MSKESVKRLNKQGYRQSWETNPILKDWIQSVPNMPDKAYCRYCKRTLYAHRYSVLKHTCTIKHQQNADKFKMGPAAEEISQIHTKLSEETCSKEKSPERTIEVAEQQVEDDRECPSDEYTQIETLDESCIQVVISTGDYLKIDSREDLGSEHQENDETLYQIPEERNDCNEYQYEADIETASQNESDMSQKKKTISTHILDTTRGEPANNVPVVLLKLIDNEWKEISHFITDNDGRIPELITVQEFTAGCYKIHFDVSGYLKDTAGKFLYPFIEIVFQCEEGDHYHIPLLLNPFGYSTYRGS